MHTAAMFLSCLLAGQLAGPAERNPENDIPNAKEPQRFQLPADGAAPLKFREDPPAQKSNLDSNQDSNLDANRDSNLGPAFSPERDPSAKTADDAKANDPGTRLVVVNTPERETSAERVLRKGMTVPQTSDLTGHRETLSALLAGKEYVGPRHAELVKAYWKVVLAVVDYHFVIDELARLQQDENVAAASQGLGPALASAIASAKARKAHSKLNVLKAQQELAIRMSKAGEKEPPLLLPVDRPLVSSYKTHFETIFANRGLTEEVRRALRLHESIPLQRDALRTAAEAAEAADEYQAAAAAAFARDTIDETTVLISHRALRDQRRAYLRALADYNNAIADYAVLAAPNDAEPATLLPMVMKVRSTTAPAPTGPSIFRQQPASQPLNNQPLNHQPLHTHPLGDSPRTFVPPADSAPVASNLTRATTIPGKETTPLASPLNVTSPKASSPLASATTAPAATAPIATVPAAKGPATNWAAAGGEPAKLAPNSGISRATTIPAPTNPNPTNPNPTSTRTQGAAPIDSIVQASAEAPLFTAPAANNSSNRGANPRLRSVLVPRSNR